MRPPKWVETDADRTADLDRAYAKYGERWKVVFRGPQRRDNRLSVLAWVVCILVAYSIGVIFALWWTGTV